MATNYETLKLIGREKFTFLKEYADWRIESLRKQYDSCDSLEDVRKIQGSIKEMQLLKSSLDKCLEK